MSGCHCIPTDCSSTAAPATEVELARVYLMLSLTMMLAEAITDLTVCCPLQVRDCPVTWQVVGTGALWWDCCHCWWRCIVKLLMIKVHVHCVTVVCWAWVCSTVTAGGG